MPREGDELLQVAFIPGISDGWIVLFNSDGRSGYVGKGIPSDLINELNELIRQGEFIRQIAFTNEGDGWVILLGSESCYGNDMCAASSGYSYYNIPSAVASTVEHSCRKTAVAFGSREDDWAVGWDCGNGGPSMETDNEALTQDANSDIRYVNVVLFYGSQWLYVYDGNGLSWSGLSRFSSDMIAKLREINGDGSQIKSIAIDPANKERYVIIWGWNGWWIKGVSDDLADILRSATGD
ncbi:MAG: hypothetical protein K8I82_28455 [Anaerolineae bacterium]|nr:hypothetical protein [Anaerolineae bacterium]